MIKKKEILSVFISRQTKIHKKCLAKKKEITTIFGSQELQATAIPCSHQSHIQPNYPEKSKK